MELAVKNMVCPRCISAVEDILNTLQVDYNTVDLGRIQLVKNITPAKVAAINSAIQKIGFELISNPKESLVQDIKTHLIALIHAPDKIENPKLSVYLSERLSVSYQTLSSVFSAMEHSTIEKYFIQLKIEKAKEWLSYKQLSLKEIAYGIIA